MQERSGRELRLQERVRLRQGQKAWMRAGSEQGSSEWAVMTWVQAGFGQAAKG